MRNNVDTLMYSLVVPLIVFAGSLINLSFIYVVWKIKEMRTHLNWILINLSIADVLYLITSGSWKLIGTLASPIDINLDQSVLGLQGCRYVMLFNDFFSFASLFFVTYVAVERYVAVCHPLRHLYISRRRRNVFICFLVWTLSMVFAALLLPAHWEFRVKCFLWPIDEKYDRFPKEVGTCLSLSPEITTASFALQTVPFFTALFMNLFIYLWIMIELHRRVTDCDNSNDNYHHEATTKQQRARNAAARMLIVNGLVFFICNSPFNILATYYFSGYMFQFPMPSFAGMSIVKAICRVLVYVNSAVNPLIYSATNLRYRKSFFVAFRCKRPLTPEALSVSDSRYRISVTHDAGHVISTAV
ncbi:Neuromedin-U receptor 2 [Holothuria leucospilota]|uniref:Neuromedin-U receptor 2 n=1 Tax=Holothuria leucospilota TaxID=206669 RepID=A0A9Q1BGB9_HOLLE|nr:Neuromedin-U receptor 2 [Holothuria leucospilota]